MNDQVGLAWPVVEGGKPHPPFWCHGATGVGRLLLHATRLGVFDGVNMLVQVAHAVADGATWSGPTLCHGLAGNADLLIDLARSTGDSRLLTPPIVCLRLQTRSALRQSKAVPGLQKHHDRLLRTTLSSLATAGWRLPICVERGAIGQRNCVERASVTKPSTPGMRPRTPDSRKRSEPHAVSPQLLDLGKGRFAAAVVAKLPTEERQAVPETIVVPLRRMPSSPESIQQPMEHKKTGAGCERDHADTAVGIPAGARDPHHPDALRGLGVAVKVGPAGDPTHDRRQRLTFLDQLAGRSDGRRERCPSAVLK